MSPTPTPPQMQFSHMPVNGVNPCQRIQTVVHAVDRAIGSVRRQGGPGGTGGGTETQLLALQIAQLLIDGQTGQSSGRGLIRTVLGGIAVH